jgi:hypothetical protein
LGVPTPTRRRPGEGLGNPGGGAGGAGGADALRGATRLGRAQPCGGRLGHMVSPCRFSASPRPGRVGNGACCRQASRVPGRFPLENAWDAALGGGGQPNLHRQVRRYRLEAVPAAHGAIRRPGTQGPSMAVGLETESRPHAARPTRSRSDRPAGAGSRSGSPGHSMQIPPHSPLQPALQCPPLTTATPPTWPFSQAGHGSPERRRSFAAESAQAGHGGQPMPAVPTTHGPSARPFPRAMSPACRHGLRLPFRPPACPTEGFSRRPSPRHQMHGSSPAPDGVPVIRDHPASAARGFSPPG